MKKVLKNARVLTMKNDSEVYENIDILIENGKIKEIGHIDSKDYIDLNNMILTPGLIDAHSHIGMWEDSVGFEGADGNETTDPITPELRAIDAINPMDINFKEAIMGGVTTVSTGPGSANCMGGSFSIIKTYGKRIDNMIIREKSAIKIAFGENPKSSYGLNDKTPTTRMAIASLIRQTLYEATQYLRKKNACESPEYNMKYEALIPVLEKEIPLKAHCHRADDIFTALRIKKEFDIDMTLDHCTEGHLISDELKKENIDIIVGPTFGSRSKVELKNKSFITPKVLQEAGINVSIMTDHPVIPQEHLNLCAQLAVKEGMNRYEALKAITINPAKTLKIDDRVGSIEVGKDADLVLWDNDPLDANSNVLMTIINGEIVYEKK